MDPTDFRQIAIQIQYGDTTADIADELVKAGVIADARAFVFEAIERERDVQLHRRSPRGHPGHDRR